MKYSWIILLLVLLGCEQKNNDLERQKYLTTIRSTYYLDTIVHDEHLFIISKSGYFIHHPNCPCLIIKIEEKTEPKFDAPSVFLDLIKRK